MASFLENMEPMEREHGAWMDLCKELRARGIVVNDNDAHGGLVNAIKKWGEELVALRVGQTEAVRAEVLGQVRADYLGQYERGEYPDGA